MNPIESLSIKKSDQGLISMRDRPFNYGIRSIEPLSLYNGNFYSGKTNLYFKKHPSRYQRTRYEHKHECPQFKCDTRLYYYVNHHSNWRIRENSSSWAQQLGKEKPSSDSKAHGANMGPIWSRQDPGGPRVGPLNFAIWVMLVAK